MTQNYDTDTVTSGGRGNVSSQQQRGDGEQGSGGRPYGGQSSNKSETELRALGRSQEGTQYRYSHPDASLLEAFPNPMRLNAEAQQRGRLDSSIQISIPEFTSLCPKTGQPDFATIRITYIPREKCVESKSLKLYAMGFRQHGAFHEAIVAQFINDLVTLLDPIKLTVVAEFAPRGGIPFWPRGEYHGTPYTSTDIVVDD